MNRERVPQIKRFETAVNDFDNHVFQWEGPEKIRTDFLRTFDFDAPDQLIKTETAEFSAVCPFSGLPDIGRLVIEYHPGGGKCVELKSLKYYLVSFRNVGIFQEEVVKRVFNDLRALLGAARLRVTLIYNTRGGFDTTCSQGSLQQ